MPEEAGLTTGVEFCRRAIERRRDYVRRGLLWSSGPIVLAIGAFVLALAPFAGTEIFPRAMPFMTLAVAWIALFLVIRVRQ